MIKLRWENNQTRTFHRYIQKYKTVRKNIVHWSSYSPLGDCVSENSTNESASAT